ncbi:hypothetical protein CSC82_06695 [Rhodobacteraceae bacterium 4F10]|nr:hypothetical protein CSC82_06695 [Rhodobacteraceae bacterium 4F10]
MQVNSLRRGVMYFAQAAYRVRCWKGIGIGLSASIGTTDRRVAGGEVAWGGAISRDILFRFGKACFKYLFTCASGVVTVDE